MRISDWSSDVCSSDLSAAAGGLACDPRYLHQQELHPMNATRILWGQVIAVFGVTLTGLWAATQWTAHALAYQPELGESWFSLGYWPIYPPPAFLRWWFAFDAYAPQHFDPGSPTAATAALPGFRTP